MALVFFFIYPINFLCLAIKLIIELYQELSIEQYKEDSCFRKILEKSKKLGKTFIIVLMPVIGILIALLVLFAQNPSRSLLKIYTETSDWNLSQRVAPPSIDDHYLCTVAAQGHPKLVKPLRKGIRHGHEITVNRQLCIANAFEELLNEKAPKLHRAIRAFYDRYGYPISHKITTKKAADFTYLFMKPLEYFFLIVLYLMDVHPENRIITQYSPQKKKEIF